MPIYSGTEQREFFVWVNPNDDIVQINVGLTGSFFGGPIGGAEASPHSLLFVHNSNPAPSNMTPFHNNLIHNYIVEYNLERQRHAHPKFKSYPSRFWALFLLDSISDASAYKNAHPDHVRDRILMRCVTNGPYLYSKHDAAWIDFLRLRHHLPNETLNNISDSYWDGERADTDGFALISKGTRWMPESVWEVLFYGRVDFPSNDPTILGV